MEMRIKIKDKERFETFCAIVGLATLLMIALATPFKKPTTWQYYDALDNGMEWGEYIASLEVQK